MVLNISDYKVLCLNCQNLRIYKPLLNGDDNKICITGKVPRFFSHLPRSFTGKSFNNNLLYKENV